MQSQDRVLTRTILNPITISECWVVFDKYALLPMLKLLLNDNLAQNWTEKKHAGNDNIEHNDSEDTDKEDHDLELTGWWFCCN